MKFLHIADVHLGSWKEPKIRDLNTQAFVSAIDNAIQKNADFVLLSGDLFNTSIPPIESLKTAVSGLKRLKDRNIPVYTIAGSHDFSPSGKTMLEVLEEAGLAINVCKGEITEDGKLRLEFTTDKKTGAKITGMIGKKGMLERKYYEDLYRENLEQETGFKIFMFHTAISEMKTEDLEKMESAPVSLLPRGFNYYAGGHVHIVKQVSIEGYTNLVYPGPTFPNSFSELEKLKHGGYYFYDSGKISYESINLAEPLSINIDCDHKSTQQINDEMIDAIKQKNVKDKIVLLKLSGTLETGKTSEVNTAKISELLDEKGALIFLKNTNKLSSKEFSQVKVKADTAEETEKLVMQENLGQIKSLKLDEEGEKKLIETLMSSLDIEKEEGEKQSDYETRVITEFEKIFER